MKFCGDCGNKLAGGKCAGCTSKSANGLSTDSLEKSLQLLEDMAKGVRPGLATKEKEDKRTPKEANDDLVDQIDRHDDETAHEGDSEEQPKTKKGVEKDKFVKGFERPMPPQEDFEDDEDPREEEEDEEEGEMNPRFPMKSAAKKDKKKAKKSLGDSLMEDKAVRNAVDVSDFLKSITDHLVESIDALTSNVQKSASADAYQKNFNQALAKSFLGFAEIVKSQNAEIAKLGGQPVAQRKSDLAFAPIEKSLQGVENQNGGEQMTKSQVAEKLFNLRMAGDNSITSTDISMAESTGNIRPDLRAKLGIN